MNFNDVFVTNVDYVGNAVFGCSLLPKPFLGRAKATTQLRFFRVYCLRTFKYYNEKVNSELKF